jgi:nitroreductase
MDMDLHNRRTIRKYASTPVSDKLLKDLLQLAARSSNTGNMQTYSVVVTRDEKKKELLSPAHFNQPMVKQAPVVLTFCADYNRFTEWCKCRQAEPGYDNFQSFIASAIDAIVWAQTFAVAAEREGLGICYLGTTTYNAHQIIEVLNLPRLVIPIVTLTLGYPEDMPELQDRLPLEAILHEECYHEATKEDIDRWYAEKEALPAMKQFVAENNKETLAQVFTDVRYTKKNNEYFSDVLLEVLKKQGFLA